MTSTFKVVKDVRTLFSDFNLVTMRLLWVEMMVKSTKKKTQVEINLNYSNSFPSGWVVINFSHRQHATFKK